MAGRQMKMLGGKQLSIGLGSVFERGRDVLLACADVLDFLRTVPDGTARLIVSSPPYNIGKEYERTRNLDDYAAWQTEVLTECKRILTSDGSLCWEVGNYVQSGEIVPLDFIFFGILHDKLGLKLRNRIIWAFEHGLHARRRLSGRYESILWFTKSDEYLFNLDPLRVPQKYPGKKYHRGPKKGQYSGNPLGKNPGDLWLKIAGEWEDEIWDIPNVKHNHPEKTHHPAQFPIELIERLVLALTEEGDTVLDPFMGVGSAAVASVLHGRRAVGVDQDESYVEAAMERVEQALSGSLRRRPLGTAKYEPNGEALAQRPAEWDAQAEERRLLEEQQGYANRG